MGVTSYPTDIDVVSTDIELVGGKNAQVGMCREDKDGRKFMLLKAGATINIGCGIVTTSNAWSEGANATSPIWGANVTGVVLVANDYFWMQTYGPTLKPLVSDGNVVDLDMLTCGTNVVTGHSAAIAGTCQCFLGWAIGDDVGTVCNAFINPGAVGNTDTQNTVSECSNFAAA